MDSEPMELLRAASAGSREARDRLLAHWLPDLHAYVHVRLGGALGPREATVDVVQSVCRQILGSPVEFAPRDVDHWKAWLFTAALNKLREKVRWHAADRRGRHREERSLDHAPVTAAAFLATPSQVAIGNETAVAIADSLEALGEDHREVLTLARLVRLPHRTIAEVMGRSEAAVRQLLGRALLAFADELARRGIVLGNDDAR